MNLKQFNPFIFSLATLVFLNTSCSKVNDLYNNPEPSETVELIPGANISEKFGWNTTQTIDVRLSVNDEFEGKYDYKLAIYDRVPDAEGAILLGAGLAKSGQDLITKITIPTGLNFVYVQQTTPRGQVTYSMVEVKSNGIQKTSTTGANKATTTNNKGITIFSSARAMSISATPTVPANATALKGNTNIVEGGKAYVINKGDKYTGIFADNVTGATVYVEGTWDKRDFFVPAGNTVIVLPEATVTGHNLQFSGNDAQFTNYGYIKFWELNILSKSVVTNYGELIVQNTFVINSNGTFVNNGTADVHMITGTGSGTVTNNGHLASKKIKLSDDIVMNVNCHTEVSERMEVDGSHVIIHEGARLDIQLLDVSKGGQYTLHEGAMIDVKNKIHFSSDKVNIITTAPAVQNALVRTGAITLGYDLAVKYQGNVQIAVDNHPVNKANGRPVYEAEQGVTFVAYAKPTVTIPATSCNEGGIVPENTNPPVDQKLEEVVLGTFTYAFEDNWPTKDNYDYDMNDFVFDVQVIKYQTKDNKVQKVVLKNKIRAIGASRRLAAAIQLDNVLASAVKSVNYSNSKEVGQVLPLTSTGVENGQQFAIVTIVDDGHAAFGYSNTTPFIFTNNGTAPIENEITIEFTTPLDYFTHDDLNPFIVNYPQMKEGRHEIHLAGRKATDKINKNVVAKAQGVSGELSPLDPFKTKDNYPFAISLPVSFQYPLEGQAITKAYLDFAPWVLSGGTTNQDWYNFPKK